MCEGQRKLQKSNKEGYRKNQSKINRKYEADHFQVSLSYVFRITGVESKFGSIPVILIVDNCSHGKYNHYSKGG